MEQNTSVAESIASIFAPEKVKVEYGEVIKVTPGKRHVWIESNVGRIRKCVDSLPGDFV